MKLCSYRHAGEPSYGVLTETGIIDLGEPLGARYPTLVKLLEGDAVGVARETAARLEPVHRITDVEFLPLTLEPVNIICQGMNFRAHLDELGRAADRYPRGFFKTRQALVGHLQPLAMPTTSRYYDYEGEYCIVIGSRCHRVDKADAMEYVAGYTILMDGSVRDFQRRTTFQGKNFWRSGAVGPCMLTRDAAPSWAETRLRTRLNGKLMQSAVMADLVHDIPTLVAYFSQILEMQPGDMISTGTTGGVGHARNPEVYMRPGDTIEVEITGIGSLRNTVQSTAPRESE